MADHSLKICCLVNIIAEQFVDEQLPHGRLFVKSMERSLGRGPDEISRMSLFHGVIRQIEYAVATGKKPGVPIKIRTCETEGILAKRCKVQYIFPVRKGIDLITPVN